MDIPKRVSICGYEWSIVEDNDSLKDSDHFGETRHLKDEIALDTRGRTEQRIRYTLLHEIIHAADARVLTTEDSLSERQVKALGAALFDTFTNNPEVMDYILGRDNHASQG